MKNKRSETKDRYMDHLGMCEVEMVGKKCIEYRRGMEKGAQGRDECPLKD